ncbi:MAG: hypothetical protein HGA45_05325 [Chloroflexales bacterium]|nr:hypothetical protein [Chloroflexales bacterium]
MQLLVSETFWALFPEARIGVATAHGLDNTLGAEAAALLDAALADLAALVAQHLGGRRRTAVLTAARPVCSLEAQP